MNKREKIQLIRRSGIIAIMRTKSSDQLVAAAEAIRKGGVQVIEVTVQNYASSALKANPRLAKRSKKYRLKLSETDAELVNNR